jgi:hypothetical protein
VEDLISSHKIPQISSIFIFPFIISRSNVKENLNQTTHDGNKHGVFFGFVVGGFSVIVNLVWLLEFISNPSLPKH